ncbi:12833_t:CDS:2 [Gigaspora margarita]|uniref:12833_t:CDS:1 n=1 Tax=Gigaspora margarita TaxID=4874 RepID=A0ABM8W3G2_GIGMA|nr:12833_t:CDS:2 [Gigaspora margarita]
MNKEMTGYIHIKGYIKGCIKGYIEGCIEGYIEGCIEGYIEGCIEGYIKGIGKLVDEPVGPKHSSNERKVKIENSMLINYINLTLKSKMGQFKIILITIK